MTTLAQALASGAPRIGVFFRLDLATPVRLWLGVGDCEAGIDAADGAGTVYSGIGEMVNLPSFTQLVNGAADRVEFRLSGVTARVLSLASSEADEVKGATLLVGVGVFDASWQLVAQPTWLRRYIVDFVSVELEQSADATTRTIALSARSFLTGRRRPGLLFWTDNDQQALHSGDRFCERTVLYSQEVTKPWPRFT